MAAVHVVATQRIKTIAHNQRLVNLLRPAPGELFLPARSHLLKTFQPSYKYPDLGLIAQNVSLWGTLQIQIITLNRINGFLPSTLLQPPHSERDKSDCKLL